jgi:hypothetical protein
MNVAATMASALARSPQARAGKSAEHVLKWAVMTILAMVLSRVGMKGANWRVLSRNRSGLATTEWTAPLMTP